MTPDYWDSYNNAARQPNALTTFVEARNRRDVGNALATGDYGAGARAAYGAGMIDQGLELQRYGQQEADRQAQMQRQQMQDQRQQAEDARRQQQDQAAAAETARAGVLNRVTALRYADPANRATALGGLRQALLDAGANAQEIDAAMVDGIDNNELDMLITELGGNPQDYYQQQAQTNYYNAGIAQRDAAAAYTNRRPAPGAGRPAARAPSSGRMSGGIGAGAPAAPAAPPWMRSW